MIRKLGLISILWMCAPESHAQLEDFICQMLEDGIRKHAICDTPIPVEVHMNIVPEYVDETIAHCDTLKIPVVRSDAYKVVVGKRVVFIFHQKEVETGVVRNSFMTYCAGSRMEGSFDWDKASLETLNWLVTTVTR